MSGKEQVVTFIFLLIGGSIALWGFPSYGPAFFIPAVIIGVILFFAWGVTIGEMAGADEKKKLARMSPQDREHHETIKRIEARNQNEIFNIYQYGVTNENLMCPHCQTKGMVRNKSGDDVTRTKVIPVVGNTIKTRKTVTKMHCDNCGTDWSV